MYVETRFGIGAISKPMFVTDIGQHWADTCNILFQYVANMTACLILVKYSFNTAKILQRHCYGTILGWYSHHINWRNIWNTPLSAILAWCQNTIVISWPIYAQCSILVQYCTNMAVLVGTRNIEWSLSLFCDPIHIIFNFGSFRVVRTVLPNVWKEYLNDATFKTSVFSIHIIEQFNIS